MKILLVDDDRDLVELLTFSFRRAGFDVLTADESPTVLKLVEGEQLDLIVLDVTLGAGNGFDVLREVRSRSAVPVIMLTARQTEDDKVRGLELGADDYITKPFSHRELIARIRAHLRRTGLEGSPPAPSVTMLQVGPITMNVAEHTVTKDDQSIKLTVTEFRLLHYLMSHAGSVVPTRAILTQVWGYDDPVGTDVVRVAVHRLRRKLGEEPDRPQLLHTVPGVGVILKPKPD